MSEYDNDEGYWDEPAWARRDGSTLSYSDMGRHHAWNAERMLRRDGRKVPFAVRMIAGDVTGLRLAFYHAWNVGWLLMHPRKINRCTLRGV